jgi:protoporphyrinogen oxidase
LIDQFDYPELGPGMMWEAARREIERQGGVVKMGCDVVEIRREGDRILGVAVQIDGRTEFIEADHVISSMPVTEFIKKLHPPAPAEAARAAGQLKYRDFLTVCLIVDQPELFADNWIYIHEPDVKVGRIQNFKNWSPRMLPDQSKTSLGLEYFCNEGDELWCTSDAELIELGKRELERIGLVKARDVEDGCVFRVPKSYPVYDADYRECLATIKLFVNGLENFQTVGRNGLHRYNNQDHAMLTGLYAARNLVLGETNDLWDVNVDQEYHEEVRAPGTDAPRDGRGSQPPRQEDVRTPEDLVAANP